MSVKEKMAAKNQTLTNQLPVREGLYTSIDRHGAEPALIASKCSCCGELFFPRRQLCQHCQHKELKESALSRRGRIFSCTTIMQQPGVHYRGPVPYSFGWVELQEGIKIETLFTCIDKPLVIGLEVEMVLKKLYEDENGNAILCHMFRPIDCSKKQEL